MIVKSLGVLSLGSMSVGGMALTHPGLFKVKRIPADALNLECHSLSEDSDFDTAYKEDNKFGKKYKNYLVGVTTRKEGDNQQDLKDWWDWAFWRLSFEKPEKGKFKDVKKGYGDTNEHLSKVCKDAYGTDVSEFDEKDDNKFKKTEVWKYCSIGGTLPQTIKEFNVGKHRNEEEEYSNSGTIGASSTSEYSILLSVNSDDNEWIWDIKNKEFFEETTNSKDNYFEIEKNKESKQRKILKNICVYAYVKPHNSVGTGSDKITSEDTVKYCSLDGMINLTSKQS